MDSDINTALIANELINDYTSYNLNTIRRIYSSLPNANIILPSDYPMFMSLQIENIIENMVVNQDKIYVTIGTDTPIPIAFNNIAVLNYSGLHGIPPTLYTQGTVANELPGSSVTSVSVANINGFTGSVTNPTTNAVINMETTIVGIVKGNGVALLAAVAGTDYQVPLVYSDGLYLNSGTVGILNNGVSGSKYGDKSILNTKIADNTISTLNIADNAVTTLKIANSAVSYAKLQDVAAFSLIGRSSGTTGVASGVGILPELVLSGSGLGIQTGGVTLPMLQTIPAYTLVANPLSSASSPKSIILDPTLSFYSGGTGIYVTKSKVLRAETSPLDLTAYNISLLIGILAFVRPGVIILPVSGSTTPLVSFFIQNRYNNQTTSIYFGNDLGTPIILTGESNVAITITYDGNNGVRYTFSSGELANGTLLGNGSGIRACQREIRCGQGLSLVNDTLTLSTIASTRVKGLYNVIYGATSSISPISGNNMIVTLVEESIGVFSLNFDPSVNNLYIGNKLFVTVLYTNTTVLNNNSPYLSSPVSEYLLVPPNGILSAPDLFAPSASIGNNTSNQASMIFNNVTIRYPTVCKLMIQCHASNQNAPVPFYVGTGRVEIYQI